MAASSGMISSAGSSFRPRSHQVPYSSQICRPQLNLRLTSSSSSVLWLIIFWFVLSPSYLYVYTDWCTGTLLLAVYQLWRGHSFRSTERSSLTTRTRPNTASLASTLKKIDPIRSGEEELSHWNCILSDDRNSIAQWHTLRSREECDQVGISRIYRRTNSSFFSYFIYHVCVRVCVHRHCPISNRDSIKTRC